jgi:hypothetical protein
LRPPNLLEAVTAKRESQVKQLAATICISLLSFGWSARADDLTTFDPAMLEAVATPAEHEKLSQAYEAEAVRLDKEAELHRKLAQAYSKPGAKAWQKAQVSHCNSLVTSLHTAAEQVRTLAAAHHQLASESTH